MANSLSLIHISLALCLHWFNPLVWLMVMLANRDLELCCDEAVLRRLGDGTGYALTLVALAEQSSASPLVSHFSHHRLRERIVAIMKYKPRCV